MDAIWNKLLSAAKSLQSCPILCNPIDGSPPGSPVPANLIIFILSRIIFYLCFFLILKISLAQVVFNKCFQGIRKICLQFSFLGVSSVFLFWQSKYCNNPAWRKCQPVIQSLWLTRELRVMLTRVVCLPLMHFPAALPTSSAKVPRTQRPVKVIRGATQPQNLLSA